MTGVYAEHIALAGSAEVSLDVADTIDAIGRNPRNGTPVAIARSIIVAASRGLVENPISPGT